MTTLAYYPGCSLKTSSRFYEASMRKVFAPFDIVLREIPDWSCCGASAAHTVDEKVAHTLVARNLALAESLDTSLFTPCSACYSRSKITNETIRDDAALQEELSGLIAPLSCTGTVEVKNIIEVLADYAGVEEIAGKTRYDLSGLKVAPYYGCVLTRMMRVKPYDDRENPESMDELLEALGTEVISWPYKMECCGASKTLTNKDVTRRLSERIMLEAIHRKADAIVTPCPLCQMNLDLLPYIGGGTRNIPVLFLTEVFELAFFGKMEGLPSHIVPVDYLLPKVKEK